MDRTARRAATALSLLAFSALALQLWLSLATAAAGGQGWQDGLVAYLGYFTVLTNLLVAMVALRASRRPDGGLDHGWRGAAVSAIVLVGLAYHLLLRHVWNPQGWQLVADVCLHYVVPLASLGWWLAMPPHGRIAPTLPVRWLLYPLLYAAYVLIRGPLVGSYPYYFIDVNALGLPRVLLNAGGLMLAFLVVAYVLRTLAHMLRARAPN